MNRIGITLIWICSLIPLCGCVKEDDGQQRCPDIRLCVEIEPLGQLDWADYEGEKVCFVKGTFPSCYTDVWTATLSDSLAILDESFSYPMDNAPVYLRGIYPVAALEIGEMHYELDGRKDVMQTVSLAGSLSEPFEYEKKRFRFKHLLTQLNFILASDTTRVPDDKRLIRLEITGTHSHLRLNVNDGIGVFGGEIRPILVYDADSVHKQVTKAETLLGSVMVEPDVQLRADIRVVQQVDTVVYRNVPLYPASGNAEAGVAYRIELDLQKISSGLWLTAEVSDWIWKDDGFIIETTY